ncbi:hypothetical protein DL96DRAFT_1635930 [Flagelloscypha sp. PMI_526]|nr:hypothetical protein DL96DRAFT_1635930 [Flagelloscypha sp. PMI_526]
MFCNCLYDYVMPFLKTLELPQIANVPLRTICQKTPVLQYITLGSKHDSIFFYSFWESNDSYPQGKIVSLSIDPFHESDFGMEGRLVKFMDRNGKNIRSLHLGSYYHDHTFPRSFGFLSSCPTMIENLLHLSIGKDLFYFATAKEPCVLSLAMFPRLESFSCPVLCPHHFSRWLDWISECFLPSPLSVSPPLPLKKIYSSVISFTPLHGQDNTDNLENKLDDWANNSHLNCSLEFSVPMSEGNEKLQSVFADIRALLPSWDQKGRLKLWVEM